MTSLVTLDYLTPAASPLVMDLMFERISFGDECWEWLGTITDNGYGVVKLHDVKYRAHRLFYCMMVAPIPQEMYPDHLCRNRACVRPGHIEVITPLENRRRLGRTDSSKCRFGHEYDYIVPKTGRRQCKTCRAIAMQNFYQRKKA